MNMPTLKRWALTMALAAGLAAPLAARAAPAAEPTNATTTTEHHAAEAGGEHAAENPAHNEVVTVQAKEAAWVVIIFLILLAILYPTAWKQVIAGLKAREDRIRKDIADAEAARLQAEATLRGYNAQLTAAEQKVREMIASATTEGERVATSIRMQAQQEAEAIKDRSMKDIDAARRQALQEIYAQAAELSTSIAEKILRRNLNAEDQRDLVNQSLEQLQNV